MLRSTSLSRHVAGTTLFRNSFLPQHFPKTTTATACPHLKMVAYSQLPPRPSHSLVSSCDRPMRFSGSVLRGQGGQMSPLVVRARMNRSSSLLTASPLRPSILFPLSLSSSFPVGSVSYFSSQYPGGGGRGPPSGWVRGAGMLGASAVVLFGKGKYVLGALKLTKLASLGSMVLTIGTYSIFFGVSIRRCSQRGADNMIALTCSCLVCITPSFTKYTVLAHLYRLPMPLEWWA